MVETLGSTSVPRGARPLWVLTGSALLYSCSRLLGFEPSTPCTSNSDCPAGHACAASVCEAFEADTDTHTASEQPQPEGGFHEEPKPQGNQGSQSNQEPPGEQARPSPAKGSSPAEQESPGTPGRDAPVEPFPKPGVLPEDASLDAGYSEEAAVADAGSRQPLSDCDACAAPTCGDGLVQASEECDDGNRVPGDGCSDRCVSERLSQSGWHACAVLRSGELKCWGQNGLGQLALGHGTGIGGVPGQMGDALESARLAPGRKVISVSTGELHTCAVLDDASLQCWGGNEEGQLGLGHTSSLGNAASEVGEGLPRVDLGTEQRVRAVRAGRFHTCAILEGGSVKCWGRNTDGQLGLGDTRSRGSEPGDMGDALPFVDLGTERRALMLALGEHHSCALLDDRSVKCWGLGSLGELGLGVSDQRGEEADDMGDALPAVSLGEGLVPVALSAGSTFTCTRFASGAVKCWGDGSFGQLGSESPETVGLVPEDMGDALPVLDFGAVGAPWGVTSGGQHNCAWFTGGAVKCWGAHGAGQLGLGDTISRGRRPGEMGDALPEVDLGEAASVIEVSSGRSSNCARFDNDVVKCWGDNGVGNLGLGDRARRGDDDEDMGANLPRLDLTL